jgi:2,4-dienoyl-CoA reductase-like NADH-dependent reductase (Old Yellow Enzyme family)
VIDAVHRAGGKMGPQLWHTGGTTADPSFERAALDTPSGLNAPGQPVGEPMSEEAIADTVAAFARAAADAKALGFDTLEIHGAHGYLIDQFFWEGSNLREDRYGGATIAERARFAAEVVAAMRQAVGPDFPILLRVSQWKQQDYTARLAATPAEMEQWLRPLVEAGVDILHCSQRRFWDPEFPEIDGENGLNFAGWARKLTGAPTISVGSVGLTGEFGGAFRGESSQPASLDGLVARMERGEFDLIAVGRALLSDPDWAAKVRDARTDELRDFDPAALRELA